MTTAISSPGSYGAGDYHLSANISGALVFTGTATLDLKGFSVTGTSSGNTVDFGVKMEGANSAITDSVGGGKITNFWCGAKFTGAGSSSTGIDYSGNRYFGVWVDADNVTITGGEISEIGGVTNQSYAIGVQISAAGCIVDGVAFNEIYPQSGYTGPDSFEGLAVNLSSLSEGGTVRDISYINDNYGSKTIGVFAAGDGGHTIDGVTLHNISSPIQVKLTGPANSAINVTATYTYNPAPPPPPPPPPPPSDEGAILAETLGVNFGNVTGKTIRVEIAASALTVPTDAPTKIRLKLAATADEPFTIGKAYIGHKATSGDAYDAASLTQLLFGGNAGVTIPTGETVWTDWLTWGWDRTSDLIVSLYVSGDASDDKMPAKTGTAHNTYYLNGDVAATPNVSGLITVSGYLAAVAGIETDGF